MSRKKTKNEILNDFKKRHGEKYDYSLIESIEYTGVNQKLPIICHEKNDSGNEHGVFYQSYGKHFTMGHGCPKCAKNGILYTKEDIEKKIKKIFGEECIIDENSIYKNAHTPMTFICKKHGPFVTKPYYLLQLHGCPICGNEKVSRALAFTQEEFLKKAKECHKNKYDYSKVNYINVETKVIIICKKHGEFLQTPHNHLNGAGCPKCKRSRLEKELVSFFSDNCIKFEEQKQWNWLGKRKVDFYLPDYNIVVECQGLQHYVKSNFGSTKKSAESMFSYIKNSDNFKKEKCEENGIKVVYFTHCKEAEKNNITFTNKNDLLLFLKNGIKQNLQL